jgi:hypothetical protein
MISLYDFVSLFLTKRGIILRFELQKKTVSISFDQNFDKKE